MNIRCKWHTDKDERKSTTHIEIIAYIGFQKDIGYKIYAGAVVAEWLSSCLAEQEVRGSIPRPRHLNFRDWLSHASKSRYGWNTAKAT